MTYNHVRPDREAVALTLCKGQDSIEHMEQTDDAPCSRCLAWADAVLALWPGESRATVQAAALRETHEKRLSPVHPLGDRWKPGERVESVFRRGPYGPEEARPGTVERIERTYGYHESLVIRFDDGEVRDINPDVMRHVRADRLDPKETGRG